MESEEKLAEEFDVLLRNALFIEGKVEEKGAEIRSQSKMTYGHELLDARLSCVASLAISISEKEKEPGKSDPVISEKLQLISAYVQGISITEKAISEGQYIKASAALKQDYEILAQIRELTATGANKGKVPNAKFGLPGAEWIYGELNKVAHPVNWEMIQELLGKYISEPIHGISPIPQFIPETAKRLYEVHVLFCFEMAKEASKLFIEMYGEDKDYIEKQGKLFAAAGGALKKAGFTTKPVSK